ncbi:MAG TPA: hypothetical protein VHA13_02745 [Gammaproteobacteria bacterium]|nr:hypothetical protein [Gammaproteobacteria bacterium]
MRKKRHKPLYARYLIILKNLDQKLPNWKSINEIAPDINTLNKMNGRLHKTECTNVILKSYIEKFQNVLPLVSKRIKIENYHQLSETIQNLLINLEPKKDSKAVASSQEPTKPNQTGETELQPIRSFKKRSGS